MLGKKSILSISNLLKYAANGYSAGSFNFRVSTSVYRTNSSSASVSKILENHDSQQVTLLEEPCIVVDNMDNVVGMKSKKDCHLFLNESKGILHRAFSVFLFNSQGSLLLQKRSAEKITFPGFYTNTCCSHPLYISSELNENNALGVKIAAQRKLEFELGIPRNQIPMEKIHFITRIHYCAISSPPWGEHEMDYILFIQADVDVNANLNEVSEHRYVSKADFPLFIKSLADEGIPITPWFKLIVNNFLLQWWDNLSNVEKIKDIGTIHRL